MKKITFLAASILITMMVLQQNMLQAQILKKIIDNVKHSQQDSKPDTPNQAETIDTTGLSNDVTRVLGAFGKAASDNPNDTSSADLVTKALGNMVGGGGVTAADSAAAIKTFRTAKGGSGIYYEFTTTTTSKNGTNKTITKSYFTSSGEGRAELNLAAMMGAKNSDGLIMLSRAANRRYGILLDDKQKKYSLSIIDTALLNSDRAEYKVTKIGTEVVDGYSCIHARINTTSGKGMFASSSTMDLWMSSAVPGYTDLRKMMTAQNVTSKMMQALDQAGCSGYFVKMSSQGKDYSMNMELTTAEKKSWPSSIFMIPAGYTQSENNLLFSNLVQSGQKQ